MSGDPNRFDDEVAPVTESDRRVRVRYHDTLKTFCQRGTGDLDQVWWMGTVRNLSGSGIGVGCTFLQELGKDEVRALF